MIKQFCDICGKETDRNYVREELNLHWETGDDEQPVDKWDIKITAMKNGGQPAEICLKCLLEMVNGRAEERK